MEQKIKDTIIRSLENYRGDNLERAKRAFRGYTPEQMAQHYGQFDETCQQILDGYQEHRDRVDAALKWIKENS
jgi:hypothetical protein